MKAFGIGCAILIAAIALMIAFGPALKGAVASASPTPSPDDGYQAAFACALTIEQELDGSDSMPRGASAFQRTQQPDKSWVVLVPLVQTDNGHKWTAECNAHLQQSSGKWVAELR